MVGRDVKKWLNRYSDIVLAVLVIGIIAMMLVPLPTMLLDVLLTLNITVAVTLLMVSLYIPSALNIAAFPSILLITTLFGLALNISSTRLILLQADAGEVIDSFGHFVVQGNYIVGGVIFLILTLVQYLVIAKGAERVSEVAARFTLDALPGKQMSIDADLRAGAFDLEEARKKRALVQKESQLYGAMDGAMKFVKGDAIAGIIITCINIVAGIIIGVVQIGLTAGDAAQTYTLLTIGDGLVSQIPALLIATTAGIIVTRVASEQEDAHLGGDIFAQILDQPKALAITSGLLAVLAVVPGLPFIPFMLLSATVGLVAWGVIRQTRNQGRANLEADQEQTVEEIEREAKQGQRQAQAMIPAVTPLTLQLGEGLSAAIEGERARWLRETIPSMREGVFYELGVKIPGVRVRTDSESCQSDEMAICLDEVPVRQACVPIGNVLVNDGPEDLEVFGVEAREATHPVTRARASWVGRQDRQIVEDAGYATWDEAEYIVLQMTAALKDNAHEFVTLQSVRGMLDQLEGPYPAAVQEVVPKLLGLQQITEVLRRLAEEKISLRNLPAILEILADRAQTQKNPVKLTEQVRTGLSKYITHQYASGDGSVLVYLLGREIEQTIQDAVKVTETGSFLTLAPDTTREILDAVRAEIEGDLDNGRSPILLTEQEVRRYLKRLVGIEFPRVTVLAYQELDPALTIQPLGRIRL